MTPAPFVSYAQNREDVVLHRALRDVERGRYVDVGANDPVEDSVSKAFYDAGWRGITVEPVHAFAELQRMQRPGDTVVEAAINERDGGTIELLEIGDARLSTLVNDIGEQHVRDGWEMKRIEVPSRRLDSVMREVDWAGEEVHFLSIDTEGAEGAVLRSMDFHEFRPWIVVVEATKPRSAEPSHSDWEPLLLASDYRFTLFDGLSRFYVSAEKWDALHVNLSAPASVLDHFITFRAEEREREIGRLTQASMDLNFALEATRNDRNAARAELAAATNDRDAAYAERDAATLVAAERERENTDALVRWRAAALGAWSQAASAVSLVQPSASAELEFLRNHMHAVTTELAAHRATLSWRITRPLRMVRKFTKLVSR